MINFTTGFECEYASPGLVVASFHLQEFGHVKPDGTVRDGFEIASRIHLASEFTGEGIADWKEMFKIFNLLNVSTESPFGAGQHVHLGRKDLKDMQVYAINAFLVRFEGFTRIIGGRDFTYYCKAVMNDLAAIKRGVAIPHDDRYRVLNVRNLQTIEYRFFKTTKDYNRFMSNMQFCIALSNFAAEDNFRKEDCDKGQTVIADFCKYVQKHKTVYPYLFKFLKESKSFVTTGARDLRSIKYVVSITTLSPHLQNEFRSLIPHLKQSSSEFPLIQPHFLLPLLRRISPIRNLGLVNFLTSVINQAMMRKASLIEFQF